MTPDDLDTKSLEGLDRIFAVEVAGWRLANPEESRERYRHWIPPGKPVLKNAIYTERPGNFSSSADAVLPWLEKWWVEIKRHPKPDSALFGWVVRVFDDNGREQTGHAPTFPHAAVKALIRAERAKKG